MNPVNWGDVPAKAKPVKLILGGWAARPQTPTPTDRHGFNFKYSEGSIWQAGCQIFHSNMLKFGEIFENISGDIGKEP